MSNTSPLRVIAEIAGALDALRIPYLVCGSMASTTYGEPRLTHDAHLVADLRPELVAPLVAALAPRFYTDAEALREAARRRSSCNVVHLDSGLKVDIFVLRDREFSRVEMSRGTQVQIEPGVTLRLATAEDTLLAKLEWFRKGGDTSQQQWRDVLGILKVQTGQLDLEYVRAWSGRLGVGDLLDRAQAQARRPS